MLKKMAVGARNEFSNLVEPNGGQNSLDGDCGTGKGSGGDTLDYSVGYDTGVNVNLAGGAGNDIVRGGSGDDDLWGQKGNDYLNGGNGDDFCKGGPGKDKVVKCEAGHK